MVVSAAGEATITLDVDWFYRKPAKWAQRIFLEDLETAFNRVEALVVDIIGKLALFSKNPLALFAGSGEKDFCPDLYRPSLQTLIKLALFCFVLFSAWGLLFAGI